jgi:adenosylcobinamide-GDP ribazoletransferase
MFKGLITAIRTLSILPVPGKDAERMASSLPWFPIVGFILGSICYAAAMLMGLVTKNIWPEGTAIVVLGCGILLTRGMHLDGLADWADGFGGGRDKQKILAIMKDPHVGAFGVISLVLIVAVKWMALTRLIVMHEAPVIIVSYIVSRTMQVELASSLPYAREEGGTAAPFVHGACFLHRIAALCVCAVLLIAVDGFFIGIAALVIGWLVCRIFAWHCRRRMGGITGDLLGAGSEITETAIFFIGAIGGRSFSLCIG